MDVNAGSVQVADVVGKGVVRVMANITGGAGTGGSEAVAGPIAGLGAQGPSIRRDGGHPVVAADVVGRP